MAVLFKILSIIRIFPIHGEKNWRAFLDDEEIPGRVSKFNGFGNFNGTNRVKMGQTEP
jgi:hypothetical protein